MGRKPNLKRRGQIVTLRAQRLTFQSIAQHLQVSKQAVYRCLFPLPRRPRPDPGDRRHLAGRLNALRHRAGISQDQLAKQAGLCHLTVRHIEEGRRWPHPGTFERLAMALDVSVPVLTLEEPLPLSRERNSKQGKHR